MDLQLLNVQPLHSVVDFSGPESRQSLEKQETTSARQGTEAEQPAFAGSEQSGGEHGPWRVLWRAGAHSAEQHTCRRLHCHTED